MARKSILLSLICLYLSGCTTDKISMSSEVGGSSATSMSVTKNAPTPSGQSASGFGNGLGLTGKTGTLTNVLGQDSIGGLLDAGLGQGNIVSDLLGNPNNNDTGFLPALAAAASGQGPSNIFGSGAGITGDNGIIADIVGTDFGGVLLGSQGIIPASLAGGNDGLLGPLLAGENANPALATISQLLPASSQIAGFLQLPALGITGQGSVSEGLLGNNIAGNIAGNNGLLGGGSGGVLAGQLPTLSTPLGAVGQIAVDTLNVVAGNTDSPLGSLSGALGSGSPVLSPLLQNLDGGLTAPLQAAPVLAPVSNITSSLPIVGGLLSAP